MATRRRRPRIYAQRRVPQSYPPAYVRAKLVPLVPALASIGALGLAAELPFLPESWRESAKARASRMGADASERSQRIFFDQPGLDTLFVRGLAGAAGAVSRAGAAVLRARIALDPEGRTKAGERAARMLPLIPPRAYDALMTSMLTVSTAVGAMRGGAVHAHLLRDSADEPAAKPARKGRPKAQLRRVKAPRTLGDLCADIDDMYWSMTAGTTVKITRVGEGAARRWLVSLPGTAHMDFETDENPADMESNIREMIGLESAMRVGVVAAIHDAMARDGVAKEDFAKEPVLMCGHSQGGIVAVALASMPPEKAGVDVQAILAEGAPARRIRIRPDVEMVSVAHDQDVIPSMDGTPARSPDRRVVVGRSLVRPKKSPLYYAHSSATYTETVRHLERKVRVAPWGRLASAVAALTDYLPQADEETRVLFYEVWQEVLEPTRRDTFDAFVALDRADDFQPVEYASAWSPAPLIDRPAPPAKRFAGVGVGPKGREDAPADGASPATGRTTP
ncbi:alpha/beta hydrolase [Actinomyces culturomici]|uniref:alpha/beta hydrolase n=1 Tax=Actinomyces culturomici TaxID=1926276 RepID=UPI0015881AA4|nr:alpha/beta hydrolase [Actinomyces culturomici]